MRIYYLLWTGAGGFIFPFISLFYADRGLSGTQMGWLGTIGSLVALVGASGAILAVLFASIVYTPSASIFVLPIPVPTVEMAGGSVRCMIAGVHLSRRGALLD